MDFQQLDDAILNPELPDQPSEVAFADETLEDDNALAVVLHDVQIAEQYRQSKSLVSSMDQADESYRGWFKPRVWPNGQPRSNLPSYLVLEAIEKILPQLHLTLWGNKSLPFELVPKGTTTPEAARAKSHVLAWAIKEGKLKEEMRRFLKGVLQYGYGVGHYYWETSVKHVKKYVRDEDGNIKAKKDTIPVNRPRFRAFDLRRVLVDPAADTQDVRESAGYVILQSSITADQLDDLRQDPSYQNVPTREELREILAAKNAMTIDSMGGSKQNSWRDLQAELDFVPTSSDPTAAPLEILEHWTDDRVITVLNRCIVIRNEENEFAQKTQVSCAFVDVLGSAWGFGIAKLLGGEQKFTAGTRNAWVDSLSLTMSPMFQQLKGIGAGTQSIIAEPGRVVSVTGELKPLVAPSVTQEALNAVNDTEARANRVVGANGGSSLPSQAMRTAEGINAFSADVTARLQYFLEIFTDLVFIPVLSAFLEMCTDHLSPEQINQILVDAEGKAWQGEILDVYNAQAAIEIDAAGKLTARVAAAQIVPLLITLLSNAAVQQSLVVQGRKFDYLELLEEALPLLGWNVDALIVPMTPEDQQRAMMTNPAVVKGQMDQQLEAQHQENTMAQISEKGYVQAGVAMIRQAVKGHVDAGQQALQQLADPTMGAAPQQPQG